MEKVLRHNLCKRVLVQIDTLHVLCLCAEAIAECLKALRQMFLKSCFSRLPKRTVESLEYPVATSSFVDVGEKL